VDRREVLHSGERPEANNDRLVVDQVANQRNVTLSCEKSTNFVIPQEEIPYVPSAIVEIEETACRQSEKVGVLGVSTKVDDISKGGPRVIVEPSVEFVVTNSGPHAGDLPLNDVAGSSTPVSDPVPLNPVGPAQDHLDPPFLGRLLMMEWVDTPLFLNP
jgi:hypothetical protein